VNFAPKSDNFILATLYTDNCIDVFVRWHKDPAHYVGLTMREVGKIFFFGRKGIGGFGVDDTLDGFPAAEDALRGF